MPYIFIVRHGQTDKNLKGVRYDDFTPEDDISINKTGNEQAI